MKQRGVTLVELMVSLAIGLIIALAAASAYIGTRSAQTASENISTINDVGKLALDLVGREVQMAGFYPAQMPSTSTVPNLMGSFTNTKAPGAAAYDQGVFGCDGAVFNPSTNACPTPVTGAPDSIVLNYFSGDSFGAASTTLIGHTRDCNRVLVSGDAANAARSAASYPLYISNRFSLASLTYNTTDPSGRVVSVNTKALACSGNGNDAQGYKALLDGVEDLVVRYGVNDGSGAESPDQFYTATQVAAMTPVGGLTGWQRVSAVRICVLVRTLDNSRSDTATLTYQNCRGGTSSTSSNFIYKAFTKTYAVRNNLHATY